MKIMRDYQVFLHFLSDYFFLYHIFWYTLGLTLHRKRTKNTQDYVKALINGSQGSLFARRLSP